MSENDLTPDKLEYRTEAQAALTGKWFPITEWKEADTPPSDKGWNLHPVRVVARRVSTAWEVSDE